MSVPSTERVSMSAATVRLGLLLREVVTNNAPAVVQNAVGTAAQAVEEEARQQLHRLRERMRHMDEADAMVLAIALAKAGEPANNEEKI